MLTSLNKEQQKAVTTTEGPLLLLAGAGSGKTMVLTHRIAYLIEEGLDPYYMLAITFTNKAAGEMKDRVEVLVPKANVWIATFHATCVRILRQHIEKIGYNRNFTIYDTENQKQLINKIIKEMNINTKHFPANSIMSYIGKQKDELIAYDVSAKEAGTSRERMLALIYRTYQETLHASNAMDFDDLIMKTVELFRSQRKVLETYQERFLYIMVDEYQDTNKAQYELIRLLAEKNKNLCVVGDDDQSIYGWRGADIRNIIDFEKDYPHTTVIKLEQNYRSTANILSAANWVIKGNELRKEKNLWTEQSEGPLITIFKSNDDRIEALFIADEISRLQKKHISLNDIAILYRVNAQSRTLEDAFIKKNTPYQLIGGVRFYDRKEIRDIMAYLQVLVNPLDEISLRRIINVPRRGIGEVTLKRLVDFSESKNISLYEAIERVSEVPGLGGPKNTLTSFITLLNDLSAVADSKPVLYILERLLEETGYMRELVASEDERRDERVENIQEFLNKAALFDTEQPDDHLFSFLEEVALVADVDTYEDQKNSVTMMTLHAAKGLEFPYIFIAGMEEESFPSYRSLEGDDPSGLEEERRLFYVGLTRAKEKIYLTYATRRMRFGRIIYPEPSRFLREIPTDFIEMATEKTIHFSLPENRQISKEKIKVAETKKARKENVQKQLKTPEVKIDFLLGDMVVHEKYGMGEVLGIQKAGRDYEVTVDFLKAGRKKMMAHFAGLTKA